MTIRISSRTKADVTSAIDSVRPPKSIVVPSFQGTYAEPTIGNVASGFLADWSDFLFDVDMSLETLKNQTASAMDGVTVVDENAAKLIQDLADELSELTGR